jgi:hypothetical protein
MSVIPTGASGTLLVKPREVRMVFKFIRAILEGRDDAKAVIAERDFLAAMTSIERLSPDSQAEIARGFVYVMEEFAKQVRAAFPEDRHQDYLQSLNSKFLRLQAEHYFAKARIHKARADLAEKSAGLALELVGYNFLSRSWQDIDHTINIDAPEFSAGMIGPIIESRIQAFLVKYGQTLP